MMTRHGNKLFHRTRWFLSFSSETTNFCFLSICTVYVRWLSPLLVWINYKRYQKLTLTISRRVSRGSWYIDLASGRGWCWVAFERIGFEVWRVFLLRWNASPETVSTIRISKCSLVCGSEHLEKMLLTFTNIRKAHWNIDVQYIFVKICKI